MAVALPLLTALVAGFAHALEADHVAAVTTFVARRPHPMRALGFGVRWGLGHSLALLLAGAAVILLDVRISEGIVHALEFGVGFMLLALGAGVVAGAGHRRTPSRAGGVGAAHGLAGTAGFLALLPAAFLGSPWLAGGYLLCFGLGTVVAMGLYGLLAGLLFHRAGEHAAGLGSSLRLATALVSMAVGGAWMYGAVA